MLARVGGLKVSRRPIVSWGSRQARRQAQAGTGRHSQAQARTGTHRQAQAGTGTARDNQAGTVQA